MMTRVTPNFRNPPHGDLGFHGDIGEFLASINGTFGQFRRQITDFLVLRQYIWPQMDGATLQISWLYPTISLQFH